MSKPTTLLAASLVGLLLVALGSADARSGAETKQVPFLNGCNTPVTTGATVSCVFICDDFPTSGGYGSGLVWFDCADGRSCGPTSVLIALGGCVYSATGNPSTGHCYFRGIGFGHCE
jgi:hypothetical protein